MTLGPHTITRVRPGTVADEYGNKVPSGVAEEVDFTGCSVQPNGGTLTRGDRAAIEYTLTAWIPGAADVVEPDTIEYAGRRYVLAGPPDVWDFEPMTHTVLRLREVVG